MSSDKTLAECALACKAWRWLPGMRAIDDWDNDPVIEDRCPPNALRIVTLTMIENEADQCANETSVPAAALPDLTDPCTLGGLLSLVREAHGCEHLYTAFNSWSDGVVGWKVCYDYTGTHADRLSDIEECPTEAEALIAALEAAP